jgi:hypothetical protein
MRGLWSRDSVCLGRVAEVRSFGGASKERLTAENANKIRKRTQRRPYFRTIFGVWDSKA